MQTPMQITIRSLTLTIVSIAIVIGMNIVPAADMQTFVLALDDDTASTTRIEYTGVPGQTVKGQIVIQNPSEKEKHIKIKLDDLGDSEIRENGLANAENLYKCCSSWINLPQGDYFTIEPGKKAVIPYEMNIPENAEAKNYYGAFTIMEVDSATHEPLFDKNHCNIVKLQIFHKFDSGLGMLGAAGLTDGGAHEINMYSPVFAVLAALMLATGIALGVRWCIKFYASRKTK